MTPADLIADRDVVVSLSGGKDSAAACLHLLELGIPHRRVYMDTGWEDRTVYQHLDVLEERLGEVVRLRQEVPILPGYEAEIGELESMIGVDNSPMVRLCVWKGCFPGQGTRWCTSHLKVVPVARWFAAQDGDVVNVVGIRRAESQSRSTALEWEPMTAVSVNPVVREPGEGTKIDLSHVEQWRPLVDWTVEDVIAIHARHDLPLAQLYRQGATRVGCWPCIYAANKEDLRAFSSDTDRIEVVRRLEVIVGRRWRERIEARGESVDDKSPPTWFQARDPVALDQWRADHPEAGPEDGKRHLGIPIDRAIEWANTARGGRQRLLFAPPQRDWACAKWGFCEMSDKEVEP